MLCTVRTGSHKRCSFHLRVLCRSTSVLARSCLFWLRAVRRCCKGSHRIALLDGIDSFSRRISTSFRVVLVNNESVQICTNMLFCSDNERCSDRYYYIRGCS